MKKKLLVAVLSAALTLSFVGCGSDKTEKTDEAKYTNGTYTLATEADDYGSSCEIVVEVKDGEIASTVYNEYSNGNPKRTDKEYAEKLGLDPNEVYDSLAESFMESLKADEVDTVSGATSTSNTFKNLAEQALEKIEKGETGTHTVTVK